MTNTKIRVLSKEWWELYKKTQREKNAYYTALVERQTSRPSTPNTEDRDD